MNVDTVYKYHPKLKESTHKKNSFITSLFINGPNILRRLGYDIKLGVMYYLVLNADTKVSYFKVAWSSDFIQTVLLYLISILYLFITVFGRPKEELVIQNTSHTLLEATNIATHLTKAPLGKLHTCKQIAADWIWLSIKLAWWQRIKL